MISKKAKYALKALKVLELRNHGILQSQKGKGAVVKKKDQTHKMAEVNKGFSHFRFQL